MVRRRRPRSGRRASPDPRRLLLLAVVVGRQVDVVDGGVDLGDLQPGHALDALTTMRWRPGALADPGSGRSGGGAVRAGGERVVETLPQLVAVRVLDLPAGHLGRPRAASPGAGGMPRVPGGHHTGSSRTRRYLP